MTDRDVREWADSDQLDDVPPTEWINVALSAAEFGTVAGLVPAVFEKYVRVLHPPARTVGDVPVEYFRWADAARAGGKVAHSRMQWESIVASIAPDSEAQLWNLSPARTHSIPSAVIREMASVLGDEDRCHFGFWEGNTALSGVNGHIPLAVVGRYRFHMFEGRAADSVKRFHGLRPSVWWSAEHAWFVASDPDLDSTYIGTDRSTSARFLSSAAIESWRVSPSDDVTVDGDIVNSA